MKCQILTRGLIPGILIRGPVANIDLAFDTICDLLDRGVDIRREDGSPFDRIPLDQQPKKAKVITTVIPPVKEPEGEQDPVGPTGHPGVPSDVDDKSPEVPPVVKEDAKEAEAIGVITGEIIDESAKVVAEHQSHGMEEESDPDDDDDGDGDDTATPTPTDPANPYAGMSKNQAKKARRAARAAAEAAAKSGNSAPQ